MGNIINFLNTNNGALMVIITAVYVLATILICRSNIKSAKATSEQVIAAKEQIAATKTQLDESKRQYEETKRLQIMPYFEVVLHDDVRDFVDGIYLAISNRNAADCTVIDRRISIKNIGLGIAKDFSYTWRNLDGCFQRNDLGFTAIIPGEEKSVVVDFCAEYNENFSEYEAPVSIIFSYKDLLENKYKVELKLTFRISNGEISKVDWKVGIPEIEM